MVESDDTLDKQSQFWRPLPSIQYPFGKEPAAFANKREKRRAAVKDGFLHAWNGYKKYALGHDEVKPLTNLSKDPFGGWGATLVDSLSTLLVMDLKEEVESVLSELDKIEFDLDRNVSVFESIIRYLGGLLSAYELSDKQNKILLDKAKQLADALLPAFDTPSGLPHSQWNPHQRTSPSNFTVLAEIGTVQLEFMVLSEHTGNPIYKYTAQAITDFLDNVGFEHGMDIAGLYPTSLDVSKGRFRDNTCTFGGAGDSTFEYFLKEYLLVQGSVPQYARMYIESVDNMKHHMLRQVIGSELLFLPPYNTRMGKPSNNNMEHLTCFVPGMLAIGAKIFDRPDDLTAAKGLLETCVYMYRTSPTGLCPEAWSMMGTVPYNPLTYNRPQEELEKSRNWWYSDSAVTPPKRKDENVRMPYDINYKLPSPTPRPSTIKPFNRNYLLRPGDPKYQEYGWEIFQAIEKHCKTKSAYAAIQNVEEANEDDIQSNQLDSMESFMLAETLKYLYLLFSPPDVISLDEFVLNTEAHPLRPIRSKA
ncbi:hypothetical protein EC973_000092 [Apophysomyces ossiformis]|uniref:alpha-1,2-Mannosidase n=1 Tax=Apophysomyces ossiformis TaxID=679940 RepID=A0A8H7ETI3_9FUNG|nr:hypothetical protein EC973_000092 [Apophysomyces ossiformis]